MLSLTTSGTPEPSKPNYRLMAGIGLGVVTALAAVIGLVVLSAGNDADRRRLYAEGKKLRARGSKPPRNRPSPRLMRTMAQMHPRRAKRHTETTADTIKTVPRFAQTADTQSR